MRIVLTVHQFLPDFSAGTEILTFSVAKELQRRGHDVEIWTGFPRDRELPEDARFDQYVHSGLTVWRYLHSYADLSGASNVIEAEYDNPLVQERFRAYLSATRPDVVHFFHLGRLSASPIEACSDAGVPSVFTPTDFWFICPMNQLRLSDNTRCPGPDKTRLNCLRHVVDKTQQENIKRYVRLAPDWLLKGAIWGTQRDWWPEKQYSPLVRALVRRPGHIMRSMALLDRVLVPTELMGHFFVKFGFDAAKVRHVPYGVNIPPVENPLPKTASPRLRLGFIGTLAEHKGAHILLEAVRRLPREALIEACVYGRLGEFPAYSERLRDLAAGDERIHLDGTFPNERIGDVFSRLDVLVVPSIWYENTPLVVYSAQATGTPVLASDVGGLSEVIHHERNGLLFEMGNAQALEAAIRRILNDRPLLDQMSRHAVRPKSVAQYVDDLEQVYSEVARPKDRPR